MTSVSLNHVPTHSGPRERDAAGASSNHHDDDVVTTALVNLRKIVFHPRNVRTDLGDLRGLTHSIAQYGVIEPVVLEIHGDVLRLREGHRRVAAARLAGLARIPAVIHRHALDDADWILHSLHTVELKRGLDDVERARAVRELHRLGLSWGTIAASLSVPVSTVLGWSRCGQRATASPSTSPSGPEETPELPVTPSEEAAKNQRRTRRPSFGRHAATQFVATWRIHLVEHPVAADQLLDALERAVATGQLEPFLSAGPADGRAAATPVVAQPDASGDTAGAHATHAAA